MKKYFWYLLKKSLLPLACLLLICTVVYVIPIAVETYEYRINEDSIFIYYSQFPVLHYENISIALGIISLLIPIYMFSYKMNKRSVDLYGSLPISKTKILVARFLVGLILLYIPYSFAYLWGFIMVAVKTRELYLINYLYLYLASLIPAFVTYSITAFIYTRANTILDGIICVVGVTCAFMTATGMIYDICYASHLYLSNLSECVYETFPFSPLLTANELFGEAIVMGYVQNYFEFWDDKIIFILINGILWTLIGIASTIGLILTEKNAKAENCGQISESIFCYKVLIPAYVVIMAAIFMASQEFVFLIAAAFAAYVLSVVYKRTFKIGWKYAVVLVACFVGGILLFLIPNAILGAIITTPITIY